MGQPTHKATDKVTVRATPTGPPPVDVTVILNFEFPPRDPRQVRKRIQESAKEFMDVILRDAAKQIQAAGYVTVHPDFMPPEPADVPWLRMMPAEFTQDSVDAALRGGIDLRRMDNTKAWVNDRYTVIATTLPDRPGERPPMVHLSIRRKDRAAVRDWRDFQRIKNDIVGPECEAVEIYPAERRLVDTANQYHLWAIAQPGRGFPFGYAGRAVANDTGDDTKAVQRPFHPDNLPADAAPSDVGSAAGPGSMADYV